MSWKRLTIGFFIAVAVLIAAGFVAVVGLMDMYDRVMGR